MLRKQILWTAVVLTAIIGALSGHLDSASETHAEDALRNALVTFAVARTLNGVISAAQGTEVALEPGGVGVVLSVGEILDPINDLIERFSAVMLVAAVVEESESVFIDLLTYADLEALKNKRQGGAAPARTTSAKQNNKRYLILTYAAEYDRVHYPLPLLFEDQPSVESLNATVARLKRENARLAATAGVGKGDSSEIGAENARLRDENEQLRQKVRQLRRDLSKAEKSATAGGVGAVELSAVRGAGCGYGGAYWQPD